MKINRRDFLKWTVASAAALKLDLDMDRVNTVLAAETDPPLIWLQGSSCTGCTISTLNVTNPTIDDVLVNKLSMKYHPNLSTQSGDSVMAALDAAATQYNGQFILVVEGAIPTGTKANYCIIGQLNGVDITIYDAVMKYGPMAKYVVAAGTCAVYGGIPKAAPGSSYGTLSGLLTGKTTNSVINLPSCPVHPTTLVQTLINLILTGVPALDNQKRPSAYYSMIHNQCPRKNAGMVNNVGLYGCYKRVGCNGPNTDGACPSLKWNNGINFCMNSNYPCIGCSNSTFPTNPLTTA